MLFCPLLCAHRMIDALNVFEISLSLFFFLKSGQDTLVYPGESNICNQSINKLTEYS